MPFGLIPSCDTGIPPKPNSRIAQPFPLRGPRYGKGIVRFLYFLLLIFSDLSFSAPPVPLPFLMEHDYDPNIDLFGGGNYETSDDNLILYSMVAAEGMGKLKRIQSAKENLERLINPVALSQLRAPAEMQKQLYLVLFWLSQAYDAEASPQELLGEICRRGQTTPTQSDETLQEVLLYNFHVAQHLGVTDFQGEIRLGQGRPPAIRENDDNPDNRLAFAIPILPPDRFPQIAHELFNYELFDGPLPKASSSDLAPSQIEFAQRLIARGLLPADALKNH